MVYLIFVTLSFSSKYLSPDNLHSATILPWASSSKESFSPQRLIHPICREGFPTTRAYGGISSITTVPAPMNAYSPILWPHTIVALAPMEAPLPTWVFLYSFLRFTALLGFVTFVNTQLGPKKTSSPHVTPV